MIFLAINALRKLLQEVLLNGSTPLLCFHVVMRVRLPCLDEEGPHDGELMVCDLLPPKH